MLLRAPQVLAHALGSEHRLSAENLASLGKLRLQQGRWAEARDLLHQAHGLLVAALGAEHRAVRNVEEELARAGFEHAQRQVAGG
ncbi:MAG: hypothetical protein ABIK62_02685 [candidate division WOR-3 bacterium]